MSTPKRRFNLLSLTFIVLCFKKSLLIRSMRNLYLREFQQPADNTFYNLKDILLFYYE